MRDSSASAARKKPVLLVVEEEEGVRNLLDLAMSKFGFEVLLAGTGNDGINLYQDRGPTGIDLVLMDVRMHGLDGPETFARLRQINPHVRCCFMSGDTGASRAQELMASGALRVFRKPFSSLGDLAKTLQELIAAD